MAHINRMFGEAALCISILIFSGSIEGGVLEFKSEGVLPPSGNCEGVPPPEGFRPHVGTIVMDEITFQLTTPGQTIFLVASVPGEVVRIFDMVNSIEYEFLVSDANSVQLPEKPVLERGRGRKPPEAYALKFSMVHELPDGRIVEELANVDPIFLNEEYLEPKSGMLFKPISRKERKLISSTNGFGSGAAQCCVSCAGFTVCGARVSGCGGACHQTWGADVADGQSEAGN